MFGWLAGWNQNTGPWCPTNATTCFNHECSGLYFQILQHVFFFLMTMSLLCGSVMNWGHICVLYSMFLVGQGFSRRCCMTNQPHEHNFYLVNPIINIDKPTHTIFGQILRHFLVIFGDNLLLGCSILQNSCKFPQNLWMLSRLRPSGRNCAQEVV